MAAMNGRNSKINKAADKARLTLESLTKKDASDSYALLGETDDDLPQNLDGMDNDMFRKNSKIEKDSNVPQAMAPAKTLTNPTDASQGTPTPTPQSNSGYVGEETPKMIETQNVHLMQSPLAEPSRGQSVAAQATTAPSPPKETQFKPEDEMPRRKKRKPGPGILKHPRTDSDVMKDVQSQEPMPPLKLSVNLDPNPVGEALGVDPNRSEKITNRKPTQFHHKKEKVRVQLPHDHEVENRPELDEESNPNQRISHHVGFATSVASTSDDHYDIGSAVDLLNDTSQNDEGEGMDEQPRNKRKQKQKEEIKAKERKKWNLFESSPLPEDDATGEFLYDCMRKFFKVITIVFCFIIVCGGAAIHKATVLLAASQVDNSYNYTCMQYNERDTNVTEKDFYKCVREGFPNELNSNMPSCIESKSNFPKNGSLSQEQLCVDIQARWIWCLVLIIATPELFVFIRCMWNTCFKKRLNPDLDALFVVLLTETLSLLGTCCFVFVVLPSIKSSVHGLALMTAVGFLPSLLNAFNWPEDESRPWAQRPIDIIALLCQLSGLVFWPVMKGFELITDSITDFDENLIWSIPLSLFLMSLTWWVNYVDSASQLGLCTDCLVGLKKRIGKTRTKIYLIVSVWKMVIVVCGMFLCARVYQKIPIEDLFNLNRATCDGMLTAQDLPGQKTDWVFLWLVNVITALASYFCARAAAKVWIQFQSYAIPLILVTPILATVLLFGCRDWAFDNCHWHWMVPEHLTFDCRRDTDWWDIMTKDYIWVMFVWWLAQLWVTKHIWFQKNDKLAKTSTLFFNPLYGGVVHEQWLLYNRCIKDKNDASGKSVKEIALKEGKEEIQTDDLGDVDKKDKKKKKKSKNKQKDDEPDIEEGLGRKKRKQIEEVKKEDKVPMIYVCATMWHETKTEMINMLKSIFRLDIDHCARKKTQDHLRVEDKDFYNFEAHIFFDDCMDRDDENYTMFNYVVNDFVVQLVKTVDEAASKVYQRNVLVPSPVKYPTPYGGRLVWTMPGGNQIVCHLKDKEKIRVKKRWSQVMYMYYFLGYKLLCQELPSNRKQIRADNTFLLSLDGDVDFQPSALRLLVDIMKKDIKVGAACGRIHPTGTGPMVWYQKFEYAMGHWMQKATEHVLGCVLCSPGCFSLFRGSAIMDDNVMQRYTTTSEEARHLVQYDQGEDRWLCTLLIQRGHRVQYSAASDSYTFAPEDFNEFYNQRRRWTPSTMANVMDLLSSWRNTVKVNENISKLYIAYQAVLLCSSLLGTGTIFLMIVGALSVAIKITNTLSFFINVIPLVIFLVLCFTTKSNVQLIVANILTIAYGLVQILVLIAIIIQMVDEGHKSPTFIFFAYVSGTFLFAAVLHPQEFLCVTHGLLYFMLVPSMYMLLMIYSLTNLNDVSWGTREGKQTKSQKEEEELKKLEAERKQQEQKEKEAKKNGTWEKFKMRFKSYNTSQKEDGWTLGIGNCFRFVCCPRPEDKTHLNRIFDRINDQTALIQKQQKSMKKLTQDVHELADTQDLFLMDSDDDEKTDEAAAAALKNKTMSIKRRMSRKMSRKLTAMPKGGPSNETDDEEEEDSEEEKWKEEEKRREKEAEEDLTDPKWIKDIERLGEGLIDTLPEEEELFFKDLIDEYLKPLIKDRQKEEKVNMELAALKNKVSFGYILLNATFIAVIFTLQQNKDLLSIHWPLGVDLKIEPIGLMFLVFFVVIMFLQTVGMVVHRMGTFLHIVANTQLTTTTADKDSMVANMINMAKEANMDKTAEMAVEDDNVSFTSETESEYNGSEEVRRPPRKSIVYRLEEGFAKSNHIQQRKLTTVALPEQLDSVLTEMLDETHEDHATPERKKRSKGKGILQRRKSIATLKFWKKHIQPYIASSGINADDEQITLSAYSAFSTITRGHNSPVNESLHRQDRADSHDYAFVNEVDLGSSQQRRSDTSNGSAVQLPKEDSDNDGNGSQHLLSSRTVPMHDQNKSDLELTTFTHTAQVETPPAENDISDPTRSTTSSSEVSKF